MREVSMAALATSASILSEASGKNQGRKHCAHWKPEGSWQSPSRLYDFLHRKQNNLKSIIRLTRLEHFAWCKIDIQKSVVFLYNTRVFFFLFVLFYYKRYFKKDMRFSLSIKSTCLGINPVKVSDSERSLTGGTQKLSWRSGDVYHIHE